MIDRTVYEGNGERGTRSRWWASIRGVCRVEIVAQAEAYATGRQRLERGRDSGQALVTGAGRGLGHRRHFHWPPAGGRVLLDGKGVDRLPQ